MARKSDPLVYLESISHYVCLSQPGGTFGLSMTVEDAVVFGAIFSRLRSRDQIPVFMHGYQELRKDRCDRAMLTETVHAQISELPPGPSTVMRDESFKHFTPDDEDLIKAHFNDFVELFSYDAVEAADEWWLNWGKHSDPDAGGDFSFFEYEVKITEGESDNEEEPHN